MTSPLAPIPAFLPTGYMTRRRRVKWVLVNGPMIFQSHLGQIEIPDGHTFDGPSVPWPFSLFVNKARMWIPSVIHDHALGHRIDLTKSECDDLFAAALVENGVSTRMAKICRFFVRFSKKPGR